MKRITIFLLIGITYATVINIPADYSTIQSGINSSTNGDTVLVQPGTYLENINFNGHNITVSSLILTTQDTSYISQTVIDGDSSGSVVTINTEEDSTTVLKGFTITNGYASLGGGINCWSDAMLSNLIVTGNYATSMGGGMATGSNTTIQDVIITGNSAEGYGGGIDCGDNTNIVNVIIENNISMNGGGIYIFSGNINLVNVTITNNSADSWGGGIYCQYDAILELEHVTVKYNLAGVKGGGIYTTATNYGDSPNSCDLIFDSENRSNIFSNANTYGSNGSDIYADGYTLAPYSVILDTFSVMVPTGFYTFPYEDINFDLLNAKNTVQVNADLYVSPDGDNTNDGLTVDAPLKTIYYANSIILADSLNPRTINLLEGEYSPQTNGENFPIGILSYVSLVGVSEESVILNANYVSTVIRIDYSKSASLSNATITNGALTEYWIHYGGGIRCFLSPNILLENLTVTNNSSDASSGGIRLGYCLNPILSNLTVTNNIASEGNGGGIAIIVCENPTLSNSLISGNIAANNGGGIYSYNSDILLNNVVVTGNSADSGGGIYLDYSSATLSSVTIADNTANIGGAVYQDWSKPITIMDSIFWSDSPEELFNPLPWQSDPITISYSNIMGGEEGFSGGQLIWLEGNIDADPFFVNPENHDYHLQEISPCIDAGDPDLDDDGITWENDPNDQDPDGTRMDMGAYYFDQTEGYCPVLGDVSDDGILDVLDIVIVVDCILNNTYDCPCADLDANGAIDVIDIVLLVDLILGD